MVHRYWTLLLGMGVGAGFAGNAAGALSLVGLAVVSYQVSQINHHKSEVDSSE